MQYETFHELEIGACHRHENGKYFIVLALLEVHEFFTTYDIIELKISKWWVVRKIQLWSLKKSFK